MLELFAVYLEGADQNLQVFDDEASANAKVEEYKAVGKSVKLQKFTSDMVKKVLKNNGVTVDDPDFWEKLAYDNGECKLIERYSWHDVNGKMEYTPEYSIVL